MSTLPPNPRSVTHLYDAKHTKLIDAISELKKSFHDKQAVIDEIGGQVEGNAHLALCNLQSRAFKAVETIEEFQVANCENALIERIRKGTLSLSKVRGLLMNHLDDDAVSTAARAISNLAKENAAPFTKDAIIDAGLVDQIVKVLVDGSFRQRCDCANAIAHLSDRYGRAKKAIMDAGGAVNALASLLCHGVMWNCGAAKGDAVMALLNLSGMEGVPVAILNSSGTIEAMLDIISYAPSLGDKYIMEFTLALMISLCKSCRHFKKHLQDRDVHMNLVPLVKGVASTPVCKFKHGVRAEAAYLLAILMERKGDDHDSLMSPAFEGTAEGFMHMVGHGSDWEKACALQACRELIRAEKCNHFSKKLMGSPHQIVAQCLKIAGTQELALASTMACDLLRALVQWKKTPISSIVDAEGVWVMTDLIAKDTHGTRLYCAAVILNALATDRPCLSQKIANTNMVVEKLRQYALMKLPTSGFRNAAADHKLAEKAANLLKTLVMELRHAKLGSDAEPAAKRTRTSG